MVAFTPLADLWFVRISGLEPELARFALTPARILVPLPALSVLLSYQRAVLVQAHRTGPITLATATEVAVIAVTFTVAGWGLGWVGVTAAFVAFLLRRTGANALPVAPVRERSRLLAESESSPGSG